jgi:DNA modification methylase
MQAVPNLNTSEFQDFTHRYHPYPAKFYPPLVKYLIENYANSYYPIADLFAGCGTTLLEAKLAGIPSIGIDINPITKIITDAKLHPIRPSTLAKTWLNLNSKITQYQNHLPFNSQFFSQYQQSNYSPHFTRWFNDSNLNQIQFIKYQIALIRNSKIQNFFTCVLSAILKKSSQASLKTPRIRFDPDKNPKDAFYLFQLKVNNMIAKNDQLYFKLKSENKLYIKSKLKIKSAIQTGISKESIGTIIMSPPYATSFEYSDLHQLSNYCLNKINNHKIFRKHFIGTKVIKRQKISIKSTNLLLSQTLKQLLRQDKHSAKMIVQYFADMKKVIKESRRILIPGGKLIMVVGDSILKSVKIPTSIIISQLLNDIDLINLQKLTYTNKRKCLPMKRNQDGTFSKENKFSQETIIISEKINK